MRKVMWIGTLLAFGVLIGAASAQTTTVYTGTIKDLTGAAVTSGQVTFTLSPATDSTIPGVGRFTASTVTCTINIDGTISALGGGACTVTRNTALTPSGTSYKICVQPNYAIPGSCFYDYAVTSTKDISTIAPTLSTGPTNYGGVAGPAGPIGSFSGATALNLIGTQSTCNVGAFFQYNNCENISITSSSQPLISLVRDRFVNMSLFGPGLNEGTASDTGHWNLGKIAESTLTSGVSGIKQGYATVLNCDSTGDCIGNYVYVVHDGGVSGKSDEADEAYGALVGERNSYFHGTWAGGTSTSPLLTYTSGTTHTTAGGILLNMSRGSYSASLTANGVPFSYAVNLPTTSSTFPISTAWCTVAAPIVKPNTSQDQYATVSGIVCTLGLIGSSYPVFHPGDDVVISGPNFPEHTTITAATAVTGSGASQTQTLTIPLRHYEDAGAMIFAGGLAGYYIDATANYTLSGMRSSYYAFASLDGSHLIAGKQVAGQVKGTIPQYQAEAWSTSGANAAFVLRPGAEITADLNDADTVPQGQSSPPNPIVTLEHNTANFTVGDVVEGPHYMTVGGSLAFWNQTINSPTDVSYGGTLLNMGAHGAGVSGRYSLISAYNDVPTTSYTSGGGPLSPASFLSQGGIWGDFANLDTEPKQPNYSGQYGGDAMGAVVRIHKATNSFYLFRLPMAGAENQRGMTYSPGAGTFNIDNLTIATKQVCLADGTNCPSLPIANIVVVLPTTAINGNTCTAPATASMPGLLTTSTFRTAFATNPNAVNGWGANGGLSFTAWPTANTLNWSVCNATAASIPPGAMSLNVGAN